MTTGAVARVTRLLEDRLDYYLVGGKGARKRLPELASEIVQAVGIPDGAPCGFNDDPQDLDAAVERACAAHWVAVWGHQPPKRADEQRAAMRRALEAALAHPGASMSSDGTNCKSDPAGGK